jgi:hypothetical protein
VLQNTEAYRHWQTARLAAARPGDQKQAAGEAFLRSQVERGLVFDREREALDAAMHLDGYALWGQAAPLYQFWPRLVELTADNAALSQRLAELGDRVLMAQMPLDGFAAGVTGFPDDSHLIQFDTGLFATVVLAAQLLAKVSLPDPSLPGPDHCVEAAGLLEVLLAEYRLLNRYVAPKVLLQSPHHAEVAGEVAHAAEVFALTHEAAHILLGHVGTERDNAQRPYDEVTADVLALHILSGVYAGGPSPAPEQQRGRLLGIRLLISCIELYEDAVFVLSGRTHPGAVDRWAVISSAAQLLYPPRILADVTELWRPLGELIRCVSAAQISLEDAHSALEHVEARGEFTAAFDWRAAVPLLSFYRRTNVTITDPGIMTRGRDLARAGQACFEQRGSLSWHQLIRLQLRGAALDPEALGTAAAGAVSAAARILRDETG